MWALKDASFNARHICEIDGKCKKAPRQAPSANMQEHPRAEVEPNAREDERGAEHRSLEVRLYDASRADIYEARIPTRALKGRRPPVRATGTVDKLRINPACPTPHMKLNPTSPATACKLCKQERIVLLRAR